MDSLSSGTVSVLIGLATGALFGVFAQQSRFCLRAATVEFWRGQVGSKFAIWLLAFAAALIATQLLMSAGWLESGSIRQLTTTGSLSGAIIGGSLFGWGMVMARGCASRLLVLSGTGNQRALVAGLVVTLVSQATLRGGLSPAREEAASWWLVEAAHRDLSLWLPDGIALLVGIALLATGLWLAWRHQTRVYFAIGAVIVGLSVALGWGLTAWQASHSPVADTLMGFINMPQIQPSFDIGIVIGVFAGSLLASVLTGQFQWQAFTEETGLARYLIGACLMGFGGMLAGGCAVGAGVTGGAVLALTAWVALMFMWLNAGLADWVFDRRQG